MALQLTKEQASLIASLFKASASSESDTPRPVYSITEMLTIKKKNSKSTGAQSFLHVSWLF